MMVHCLIIKVFLLSYYYLKHSLPDKLVQRLSSKNIWPSQCHHIPWNTEHVQHILNKRDSLKSIHCCHRMKAQSCIFILSIIVLFLQEWKGKNTSHCLPLCSSYCRQDQRRANLDLKYQMFRMKNFKLI